MDYYKIIKEKVKCCFCEGPLVGSLHLNVVTLDRIAKWPMPTVSNVYIPGDPLQAVAILCDRCFEYRPSATIYVIEWTENLDSVKYHLVEDLDTLPIIIVVKHSQLIALGGKNLLLKKVFAAFCDQD